MNRAERRKQAKQAKKTPSYKRLTREQRKEALVKNGITIEDLEREYKAGFSDGFKAASPGIIETIYAAVALATHDLYRHGRKRVRRTLNAVDRYVTDTFTSKEIIDEVWERIGLHLDFRDPMELVKETEVKK